MLREIISPILKLFSCKIEKEKRSVTYQVSPFSIFVFQRLTLEESCQRDCHEAVERASIRSDGYNQPSRIFHKSILQIQLVGETRNGTKIEINYFESKSHLSLSLYPLFLPHLCCLADKRLVSSPFLFSPSVFFNGRKYSKVRTGNTVEIRLNLLWHALGRVSGE